MMERALKERIIGAAVLVLVVVLVVPVFLDGPPQDAEIISEQVPLPGQASQETRTVVLDRDRSEPVPANGNGASEVPPEAAPQRPMPQPVVQQEEPEPQSAAETPVPQTTAPEPAAESAAVASQTGMWTVQLGSFSNRDSADRLAAELRQRGYNAFLGQVMTSDGQLHRVRVGPQKDRAEADAVAAKLRSAGYDAKVLPHP